MEEGEILLYLVPQTLVQWCRLRSCLGETTGKEEQGQTAGKKGQKVKSARSNFMGYRRRVEPKH